DDGVAERAVGLGPRGAEDLDVVGFDGGIEAEIDPRRGIEVGGTVEGDVEAVVADDEIGRGDLVLVGQAIGRKAGAGVGGRESGGRRVAGRQVVGERGGAVDIQDESNRHAEYDAEDDAGGNGAVEMAGGDGLGHEAGVPGRGGGG